MLDIIIVITLLTYLIGLHVINRDLNRLKDKVEERLDDQVKYFYRIKEEIDRNLESETKDIKKRSQSFLEEFMTLKEYFSEKENEINWHIRNSATSSENLKYIISEINKMQLGDK